MNKVRAFLNLVLQGSHNFGESMCEMSVFLQARMSAKNSGTHNTPWALMEFGRYILILDIGQLIFCVAPG